MEKLIKPIIVIALIIVLSAVFSGIFAGSETLNEYAAKNPETESPNTKVIETKPSVQAPSASSKHINIEEKPQGDIAPMNTGTSNEIEPVAKEETPDAEIEKQEEHSDRTEYKEGFYYEPLSEEIKTKITGISYPAQASEDLAVSYDDLRYLSILYYNFKGIERTGELICNKDIAQDFVEIFYELYQNQYPIEQIQLIDEYSGDDTLSMQDNNTSCFNYRVVDGTTKLSKHALGRAIDINPFYNPYVEFENGQTTYISPKGSETYADRSQDFSYKIDENDLCYKLFKEHGFTWGGVWNSCKDYQHFQK